MNNVHLLIVSEFIYNIHFKNLHEFISLLKHILKDFVFFFVLWNLSCYKILNVSSRRKLIERCTFVIVTQSMYNIHSRKCMNLFLYGILEKILFFFIVEYLTCAITEMFKIVKVIAPFK